MTKHLALGYTLLLACLLTHLSAGADGLQHGSADGDLYVANGAVHLAAPVNGDLTAVGGAITIDQPVKHNATATGGSIEVQAPVGAKLHATGGDISLKSRVGGELLATGGNVRIAEPAQIVGAASIDAAQVTIDGKVGGPLTVRAQRIVLNGEVAGNADLRAQHIELGARSRIGGSLHYSPGKLEKADTAVIAGPVTHDTLESAPGMESHWAWHWSPRLEAWDGSWPGIGAATWTDAAVGYLVLLGLGALLLLAFPGFCANVQEQIHHAPGRSVALGFVALFGIPMLAILFTITLIGIPFGVATFALYPILLLLGYLAGVLFLAQRVAGHGGVVPGLGRNLAWFAAMLLLWLLVSVVPAVGPALVFATLVTGLGACLRAWYRRPPARGMASP